MRHSRLKPRRIRRVRLTPTSDVTFINEGALGINSGSNISSTSAGASSFMEGPLPDFLEPLRDGARKAQSFADEMKKQEEDLDAVANGRGQACHHPRLGSVWIPSGAPPGFSLIQEGVGGMDAGSREVASAMEAEAADDSRTDKHLAKASDAVGCAPLIVSINAIS